MHCLPAAADKFIRLNTFLIVDVGQLFMKNEIFTDCETTLVLQFLIMISLFNDKNDERQILLEL